MTREDAIKIIRKMLAYTDLTVRANLNADMVSACNLAIKALEQETVSKESYDHEYFLRKESEIKIAKLEHDKNKVLDKIRAEIERQERWLMDAGYNQYNVDIALNSIKLAVDKNKAETEADNG